MQYTRECNLSKDVYTWLQCTCALHMFTILAKRISTRTELLPWDFSRPINFQKSSQEMHDVIYYQIM